MNRHALSDFNDILLLGTHTSEAITLLQTYHLCRPIISLLTFLRWSRSFNIGWGGLFCCLPIRYFISHNCLRSYVLGSGRGFALCNPHSPFWEASNFKGQMPRNKRTFLLFAIKTLQYSRAQPRHVLTFALLRQSALFSALSRVGRKEWQEPSQRFLQYSFLASRPYSSSKTLTNSTHLSWLISKPALEYSQVRLHIKAMLNIC